MTINLDSFFNSGLYSKHSEVYSLNLNPDPGDSRMPFLRAFMSLECIVLIEIPSACAKTFAELGSPQATKSAYFCAAVSTTVT